MFEFDKNKIVFLCYYPGAGGQFLASTIDLLIGNKATQRIEKTGAVNRGTQQQFSNSLSLIPLLDQIGVTVKLNNQKRELFNNLVERYKVLLPDSYKDIQTTYVEAWHIMCLQEILDEYKNKVIVVTPKTEKEYRLCVDLWSVKNKNLPHDWHGDYRKFYDNINPWLPRKNQNILKFSVAEIFDSTNIKNNLQKISEFLEIDNPNFQVAELFYIKYLKYNASVINSQGT